jgi:hypothetical protein
MAFGAPLTPQELDQINSQAAAANAAFARAMAQREAGRQQLDLGFMLGLGKMARQFVVDRNQAGSQLASRGLAFSPGTAGKVARQLRDAYASQRADLRQVRTQGLTDLAQQLSAAQQQRDAQMADLARYQAQLAGSYNRFL